MKSGKQMLKEEFLMNKSESIDNDLHVKLKLYKDYSESILEMKSQKLSLDEALKLQKNPDEIIVKNKSELSKKIVDTNKEIKALIDSVAQLIMTTSSPYIYLAKLEPELADEVGYIIAKNKELNKKLKSALIKEIAAVYDLNQDNIFVEQKQDGKQDGFIIKDKYTGLKLFTKTSKVFGDDIKSIDPRELFAYKVLEHMELGPETRFIITAGSSNPSGAKICHIVTKDVAYSDKDDIQTVFFTDNFITEEHTHANALKHWHKSLDNKEFRVKFLTLSIVNDLLHLNDSFATNAWNYGSILQESKTTESQYKATLIDHEVKNSLFKYEPDKNPVISLIEKLKTNASQKNIKGELISYKIIKDNAYFTNPEQIKPELLEVIYVVNKKLSEVVKFAEEDIKKIISRFKESFSESGYHKLEEYSIQTEQNIKLFNEMQNSYMNDSDKTSEDVIELLKTDIQFQGENSNEEDGLYLKDIEYNLQMIKNEDRDNSIFNKVVAINSLCSTLGQNQHLYVINPEGISSKFSNDLLKYKNSNVNIISANIQKDGSTCVDHSLLLLRNIITSNNLDFHKLGIVIISNEHGNHANLFIISSNSNLQNAIENNIASFKTILGLNDIVDYPNITLSVNDTDFISKFYQDDDTIISTIEHNFAYDNVQHVEVTEDVTSLH